MFNKKLAVISFVLSIPFLGGCGGGGGGGGDAVSTPTTSSAAQISIDSANAPSVGGAVAGATTSTTSLGPVGGSVMAGVALSGGTTPSPGLVKLAVWQLTQLSTLPPQTVGLMGAAMVASSQACSGSGNFSYSYSDADNNGSLSIGEAFSVTFNSCMMEGAPANGTMTLLLSSAAGTPGTGAWNATMTMTFSDFTVSAEHLTGDISMQLSANGSSDISATISGSSLGFTNSAGKVSTMTGYSFSMAYNDITKAYTSGGSGTLTRSDLGGAVSFNTSSVFAGNFANNPDNPMSGTLYIGGANNSKLRLTAIDNIYVELAVDANGDGAYETTATTTWAAISDL